MNIQQLEYILALDRHRNFVKAASECNISQPTLSMMIKKLEDELNVVLFERHRSGVIPTKEGIEILQHASLVVQGLTNLKLCADELAEEISGELRIGIIPTLAPYLLPLFLKEFSEHSPKLKIQLKEMTTREITQSLKEGMLDLGLLATPLKDPDLKEIHLFLEEFYVYASENENLPKKKYLLPDDIDPNHLWLLEEGHCLRNQIFNLCELKKSVDSKQKLNYEAGSIETLIHLVDRNHGITIIPYLASVHLSGAQKKNLREFAIPKPAREISIVIRKSYPRKKILIHLKREILQALESDQKMKDLICKNKVPDQSLDCKNDCFTQADINKLNIQ
ncbi:MAG: LysR family transcriptional regulator [Saprospiraceae bacterium]|nr:LysR family transcriptional regulator [Saprospiraceae bacterium]